MTSDTGLDGGGAGEIGVGDHFEHLGVVAFAMPGRDEEPLVAVQVSEDDMSKAEIPQRRVGGGGEFDGAAAGGVE